MNTNIQIAELQRAAATLSATLEDGPCDDTCACTTDRPAPSSTATSVPIVTNADPRTSDGADEVPIACTLGAGEMATRVDEWSALLADKRDLLQGVSARHALDDGVRLEFGENTDVTEIARLAAAEQGCCRFFDFALVIDGRGIALEVHAPPDAQPVLTALFGAAE